MMDNENSTPAAYSVLKNIPLFSDIPPILLEKLASSMDHFECSAGEYLLKFGDPFNGYLYVVLAGQMQATVDQVDGKPLALGEINPGSVVGEVGFMTGLPRTANLVALSDCQLAGLSRDIYIDLLKQHTKQLPELEKLINNYLRTNRLAAILPTYFGSLNPETFDDIKHAVEWVDLPGNAFLMKQGEPGDSMYIIISGRLRAIVKNPDGSQQVVAERIPGELIGEMGIISGEPRSADVYSVRDSLLAKFSKEKFDALTDKYPHLYRQISLTVIQRFYQSLKREGKTIPFQNIALIPAHPDIPIDDIAHQLALALCPSGKTIHLNSQKIDTLLHTPGIAQTPQKHPDNFKLSAWLDDQETNYQFVITSADFENTEWTQRCFRQADRVMLLVWADMDPENIPVSLKNANSEQSQINTLQELVLLHKDGSLLPSGTNRWLNTLVGIHRHYHVRLGNQGDFGRIARFISSRAVCLVLSGGGARGFAHIGVIRALEARGIEVDLIGGSSMGGLISALYAMGWDYDQMKQKAQELLQPKKLLDFTLPLVSVFSGKHYTETLQRVFGDTQIEDTWREFFCMTTNLTKAQETVNRRGLIWKVLRASTAIPMIFTPVYDSGDLMVDGGAMNNLPLNIMQQLANGGLLIGVDVSLEEDLTNNEPFDYTLSGWQVLWRRLNPLRKSLRVPSIFSILMRALELHTVTNKANYRELADIYIRPEVSQFSTFDFSAFEEIIDIGYQAANESLDKWEAQGNSFL